MFNVKQKGLSPIGVLFAICIFAFVVMVGLKLTPHYMEYNTIRSTFEEVAAMPDIAQKSQGAIIDAIEHSFLINSVRDFELRKNIYFSNEKGDKVLGFSYEVRDHLFANIDVVLSFSYEKEIK